MYCRKIIFATSVMLFASLNAQFTLGQSAMQIVAGLDTRDSTVIDFAPSISADGKTMIFQSNRGINRSRYFLFQAKLDDSGRWGDVTSLDNINNFGDSLDLIGGPSISFDGNTLFFFAFFAGGFGQEDIYYSVRDGETWSAPINIGGVINSSGYEGFPSISADGKTLYYVSQNYNGPTDRDIERLNQFCTVLMKSERDESGNWGPPKKLPFPINLDCEKAPRIMADNKTLVFASNRPGAVGGIGDYDLYQTRLNILGEWGPPIPLNYVNTIQSEQFCSISASGELMYYVQAGRDIFSVPIPQEFRQFVNTIVQGYITDMDDKSGLAAAIIVTDALTSDAIMTMSNNPSDGRYTLVLAAGKNYNIEVRKQGYSSYTTSYDLSNVTTYREISNDIQLFSEAKLAVSVSDEELLETITASVTISESGGGGVLQMQSPKTGRLELNLPLGKKYHVEVQKDNFEDNSFELDLTGLVMYRNYEEDVPLKPIKVEVAINVADLTNNSKVKSRVLIRNKNRDETIEVEGNEMVSLRAGDRYQLEVTSDQGYAFNSTEIDLTNAASNPAIAAQSVNVELQKLEANASLTLKEITFESNSFNLSEISFTELQRVVKLMRENPTLKVEIAAHTDDIGSDAYNRLLSQRRAQSVVNFLIGNDISSQRFVSKGYGESQPLIPNDSEEGRARNRRVELIILAI
ncbi:MAG TPA: OmpA family protein [Cyclobacteriaceae bacterium]|jgi:outer membrane protein OmpA-like peptidoglycan-associated protein